MVEIKDRPEPKIPETDEQWDRAAETLVDRLTVLSFVADISPELRGALGSYVAEHPEELVRVNKFLEKGIGGDGFQPLEELIKAAGISETVPVPIPAERAVEILEGQFAVLLKSLAWSAERTVRAATVYAALDEKARADFVIRMRQYQEAELANEAAIKMAGERMAGVARDHTEIQKAKEQELLAAFERRIADEEAKVKKGAS